MPIVTLQKKMMQLGRVRLGQKGPKGEPQKLGTFRFTSASRTLLDEVAERYGGEVRPWENAPDEGYFEVVTEAAEMDVILLSRYDEIDGSPTTTYSQWYELWSRGGCQRRCDGLTEQISQEPCLCDPEKRDCQIVTRVSFMLPGSRVGLWRLDTRGYYAAVEAPAMLDFLRSASQGDVLPAVLRIENRTLKRNGQTRRFIVPVFDFPGVKVPELPQGSVPLAINTPAPAPPRPELPKAAEEPEPAAFENHRDPGFGESPEPPTAPTNGEVTALSAEEFDEMLDAYHIDYARAREVGKSLFPGKSPSKLTKRERAEWWRAVEREAVQA